MPSIDKVLTPSLVGILDTLGTDLGNVIANYAAKTQSCYLTLMEQGNPSHPQIVKLLDDAETFIGAINKTFAIMTKGDAPISTKLIRSKAELDHFEQAITKRKLVAGAYVKLTG